MQLSGSKLAGMFMVFKESFDVLIFKPIVRSLHLWGSPGKNFFRGFSEKFTQTLGGVWH